jgi:hypothetical protein
MASETELLNSSGLVLLLRDPNTGEVLHLNFPPGITEIPLEAHFPARLAKVTLKAHKIPNGGEYDVRLHFDSAPPRHPADVREVLAQNSMKDMSGPGVPTVVALPVDKRTEEGRDYVMRMDPVISTPITKTPEVTSVIAPKPTEVTPVQSLQVEPSVPAQGAAQDPPQGAPASAEGPKPQAPAPGPQEALKKEGGQEPSKALAKETPKITGAGGRKGL